MMSPSPDVLFRTLADPTRRAIFERLCVDGEQTVGALTAGAGVSQPAVSKHLGVLRKVGLVTVSKQGQRRLYELNAKELKPVYDWAKEFERFWTHQLDRIKERAERAAAAAARAGAAAERDGPNPPRKENPT